jgi:hypothetical protein
MTKVSFDNLLAQEDEAFCNTQQEILLQAAEIITDILGSDSPYAPLVEVPSSVEIVNSKA